MSKLESEIAGVVIRVALPGSDTPPYGVQVPTIPAADDVYDRLQQAEPETIEMVDGPRIDGCYIIGFNFAEQQEPGSLEEEASRLRRLCESVIAELVGLEQTPELGALDEAAAPAQGADGPSVDL